MRPLARTMVGALCALTLAATGGPAARGDVLISEVMANPEGSEFRNEFIELINTGDTGVDLAGWRVTDGFGSDVLSFAGRTVMGARERCLIVDPDYAEGGRPYGAWPAVVIATVADGAFGHAGLSNTEPERVSLLDAAGDTVSSVRYALHGDGTSHERVIDGAGPGRWLPSRWRGGTPGRRNSVSPPLTDLAIRLDKTPRAVAAVEAHDVGITVVNSGRQGAGPSRLTVTWPDGRWSVGLDPLPAGASHTVDFRLPQVEAADVVFECAISLPGDDDPTNDTVTWEIRFGARPGSVVFNELMPAPSTGPEWIELMNRSDGVVSLAGWRIEDASGRAGEISGAVLQPGELLVIADDAPSLPEGWWSVSAWPTLNNGGDDLVLQDAAGTVIDRVTYGAGPGSAGRSVERIDPDGPSDDPALWIANALDPRGTPGRANRASAGPGTTAEGAAPSVAADPDPFDRSTTIRSALPGRRSYVLLHVYDRRGRLRRSLLDGVEVGAAFDVPWDGRDDSGRLVRPGVYVLYLESSGADGRVTRARSLVTFAKGL